MRETKSEVAGVYIGRAKRHSASKHQQEAARDTL